MMLPRMKEHFTGDQKNLTHFLVSYEKSIIHFLLPRVPMLISTVHLTLMTILWSAGIVVSGYLAASNIHWLWAFSTFIFLQHITDMLDGAVGRDRNTGLIKWGFYMDHFLDYVFLCAIVTGYAFMLPASFFPLVLLCLGISGGFMVHAFLDFAITNDFKISFKWFGVSEVRYVLMIFNTILVFTGKALLIQIFPGFVALSLFALCAAVYKSQQVYRAMDMVLLKQQKKGRSQPQKSQFALATSTHT
jgi:phosphatidylglycerophosphate synthase